MFTFLHDFVVIGITLKSGSVWSSVVYVLYDGQFFLCDYYKVGKYMMSSIFQICSDFKSRVVYSSLKDSAHQV